MKNILLLLALIVTGLGSSQDLLMQNGTFNQCSGLFYDSGGEFGNYGNNENLVTTICSDVAGDFVQLNFTQFVTQGGAQADTMYIYDGDDTTAALIGSYTLTNSPGVVSASESNTSGCLTIEFVSSPSGNAQGWIAEIECFTPCQTITASIDDTTPAAVAGVIEVDPGDIVTFNGSATFSEDGTGAEYSWDFGNGASMAGQTVNYAYPNPGTYIVTLTVSDDNPLGCFASSNTIEVKVLDNDMCSGALPICGDIEDVPSPVGAGYAENGINYGCLSSVPNPRWYFMQTGPEAGTLNFTLSQNTGQNGTGSGLDIDFILWGPFDEPVCGPANLNPTNQVDCSYSADSVEQIDIPNAPANSYYVLLITNYSGNAGYINLQMNPVPGSNATTNCDIICQVDLGDDQQICNGGSYTIEAEFTGAFNTFEWQLDGETIPGETGSTLTVTESGTYKLIAEGFDAVFGDPCTAENEVVVTIADSIALNDLTISTCSASTTNADFDLDAEIVNILSPLDAADYSVTFHNSLADAEADAPSITGTDSYNGTDGEVIHVRVEANGTDCFAVSTITLGISPQPALNPAPNMELCDDNSNDGFESFDLSAQTASILGGQSAADFTVTYHLSAAEADLGDGALPLNYTNTVNPQPIFVRVESVADANCYNFSPNAVFDLIVNTRALATAPNNLETCDDVSGDGFASFDLGSQEGVILGGQDSNIYEVTFHDSQDDANTGANSLPSTYTNTTANQQTIYVRVEDPTYPDCYGTTTFDLIVHALPTAIDPSPLEVCDDGTPDGLTQMDLSLKNGEITGGNPGYAVRYYETLAEAEAGSDANALPTLYTNTSNGQFIFVRVEDTNTGCYTTTSLELIVQQAPVANTPQPLYYCDPDNDGFGEFTLTDADAEITGGAPGLEVTYHETMVNALNGVDAVDTTVSYSNIVVNTQTLYARVESSTIATDCATIVELQLIVEPTPQLIEPTPLEVCDDISADGYAEFNLTLKNDEVLNGQDPAQYMVSYYLSEDDAETATSPIANPTAFTNTVAFNQTIWIRVEDNTTEGCYKTISLELIVNALPVLVTPAPLELCDVNNPGDEKEPFTLEDANEEILNGQTGITLTYYETQLDADNATAPISSPYVNTINAQTIFVRAENDVTGCYNTVTITLRVDPIPSPEPNPTPIEVCDDDNDGFAEFDLEQRTIEITNGEPNVAITYHETLADAEQGNNAITGLYINIVAHHQFIFVRSENTLTGCYSLTTNRLELIVNPAPEVPTAIEPYTICDTDNDGIAQFDLTTKDEEILNGQNPTEVQLTYHVSAANADSGTNPIINVGNYTNTGNPQTIYVRLYDPSTGCYDTGEFELMVSLPPVAVQPTQLSVCDDLGETPGDEITVFDLTVKDNEITGGNGSWSVAYYETNADAQAQQNAIEDPTQYTNTSVNGLDANPQTLYAVVTDTNTGCVDFVTLTIRVLPNPTPTPSELLPNIELCDDVNTGDGVEVFDLTENEVLILNGEAGVTASYYETLNAANLGTNAIPDPTQYTNIETPQQEIYVRVTNNATGCYELVDFTIVVHPLPEVVAVTDMIQCELFTDGIDSFDLSTKNEEVLNGQDPTLFTVSYHATLADAEGGANGLVSPYTNTTNPQQIFVRITNNETGCSISTQSFNIEVHEAAQANPDMEPIVYELCDDEMEIDGDPSNDSVQFDLTTMDDDILDGQDAANYIVTYYATEEDANLYTNPLPTLYENVVNPQVIYARVDNDTPDGTGADSSICYEVAELTLQVNPLPNFDLADSYTLCLNTNGTEALEPLVIDTGLAAGDYTFVWSYNGAELVGENGPSIMPTQGGSYHVFVTDISTSTVTSCTNEDTTEVIESEPPSLQVSVVTQAFGDNNVIEAVATGVGGIGGVFEYSLDGGPWQDEGVFSNVSAGSHYITARDRNGCGLTTETVFVLDYPLYFTPNGDGNNDTWNIEGIGANAKIYIFDRYGKLLKQLSPTGEGWDGTFNGNSMPTSDYWFTVEYDEPLTGERKEFKAHFTLKR